MFQIHCFPALFAPASLKQNLWTSIEQDMLSFSGAFCAGLIEAFIDNYSASLINRFSGAFCAGLIEAFPVEASVQNLTWFSGAFCAGLIEAVSSA